MAHSTRMDPQTSNTEPWPQGVPGPGELVGGKYVCERLLGMGGMGVVLAGRHEQLGQAVAIKVLLPHALKDPVAAERFLREARAAVAIRSDHVARVMDFGTLDSGAPYLVMEHLEGCDLKQVIIRLHPIPIQTAVDYVVQASEALFEAHRRGIVHRDLKPANLFLTSDIDGSPHVKVLDFGISKTVSLAVEATGSGDGITRTDAVFGTPAYMSPEQLRSSKQVDLRTDLWSMGVVLYELVTGKLPFGDVDTGVVAMCARILEDPPAALRSLRPDVPPAVESAVIRCLAKRPLDRFQNIAELADALAPFGSPSSAQSAARIARMSLESLPSDSKGRSGSGRPVEPSPPQTPGAWTKTQRQWTSRSIAFAVVGITSMVGLGFALGAVWVVRSQRAGAAQPSPRSSAEAEYSAAVAVISDPPASSSPAADVPVVDADGSLHDKEGGAVRAVATASQPTGGLATSSPVRAPAGSTTPQEDASKAPRTAVPECDPGKVLTNGHCCRPNFEWKGNECVPGVAKGL